MQLCPRPQGSPQKVKYFRPESDPRLKGSRIDQRFQEVVKFLQDVKDHVAPEKQEQIDQFLGQVNHDSIHWYKCWQVWKITKDDTDNISPAHIQNSINYADVGVEMDPDKDVTTLDKNFHQSGLFRCTSLHEQPSDSELMRHAQQVTTFGHQESRISNQCYISVDAPGRAFIPSNDKHCQCSHSNRDILVVSHRPLVYWNTLTIVWSRRTLLKSGRGKQLRIFWCSILLLRM